MRLHRDGRKRLAKLLLIQEISHRQLAEAVGWKSHGMVGHLISGRRVGVEPQAAIAMAKFLGVELSDLFLTQIPAIHGPRTVSAKVGSRGSASLAVIGSVVIAAGLLVLLGVPGVVSA